MSGSDPVRQAVANGLVRVACLYQGWLPDELRAALPEGWNARQFVLRVESGRVTGVERGLPEEVAHRLLPGSIVSAGP
jgi:hypothetical protein